MKTYDAIVVGLGAMGSASLYQLAKRGLSVLGLDQFSPPHIQGSTHGPSRVMRRAIGEGVHLTPLALRSYDIFQQIEKRVGSSLLETTGMLVISNIDKSKIILEGNFFDNTVAAARNNSIRHDILDAVQLRKRFPQFKVHSDERGYFEHDAGYLRPEGCIRAQLMLAQESGAELHTTERVQHFSESNNDIIVVTEDGTYHAKRLVLCAGPWIANLIGTELAQPFKVYRQVQYWFDISASFAEFKPGICPIYFWQLPGVDEWIYGFPAIDGPHGGLLVSAPDSPEPTTAMTVDRHVPDEQVATIYERYISPHLNNVGPRCLKRDTCLITATGDSRFVIDTHPVSSNIIICSPCSGHGFKHSAAIGECVAQMVAGENSAIDMSAFRFPRIPVSV